MASASTQKPESAADKAQTLPEGFVSPFTRVPMAGRIDDALACIATLTGQTLAEVTKEAIAIGYPEHGPATLDEEKIAKLCIKFNLVATRWKEWKSWAHTACVAIVYVDWDDAMEIGRHVVYHAVHATPQRKSFRYIIDPAPWLPADRHITTSIDLVVPDCYIGISRASGGTVKPTAAGKKA